MKLIRLKTEDTEFFQENLETILKSALNGEFGKGTPYTFFKQSKRNFSEFYDNEISVIPIGLAATKPKSRISLNHLITNENLQDKLERLLKLSPNKLPVDGFYIEVSQTGNYIHLRSGNAEVEG